MRAPWFPCALFMFTALAFAACEPSDAAESSTFTTGLWDGGAYKNDQGEFTHCAISAKYKSGILLVFNLSHNYTFRLGLHNSEWKLTPQREYSVSVSVDNLSPIAAKATALNERHLSISLPSTETLFGWMKSGQKLHVFAQSETFQFRLDGTAKALERLRSCVYVNKQFSGNRDPFVSRSTPKTPSKDPFSQSAKAGEEVFDIKLFGLFILGEQNLSDYKVLKASEVPKSLQAQDLVWASPGVIGGIIGNREMPWRRVSELTANIVAGDGKACPGDFASGIKQEALGENFSITRVLTACRGGKKSDRFSNAYLFIPHPDGGIIRVVHSSSEPDLATKADNQYVSTLKGILTSN